MKILRIINHPFFVLACFSLVLISGQHLGGFYLLYVLLGLPSGEVHSLLAVAGLAVILFSNFKYRRLYDYSIEPILNVTGSILLALSLYLFFYNDNERYNYSTFYQTVPVMMLVLFAVILLNFLVRNLIRLKQVAF